MMRTFFIFITSVLMTIWGCAKKPAAAAKSQPPATIENAVKETSLTTLTLTSEAVKRLGIELAAVEVRSIEKNKTYGAEIVPVSGRSLTIVAPLSGTLLLPEKGLAPAAGMQCGGSSGGGCGCGG